MCVKTLLLTPMTKYLVSFFTYTVLGAPTGSGKTVAAEMAIFRLFKQYPGQKAVYIAPLKALVRERMEDWKVRIEKRLGKK